MDTREAPSLKASPSAANLAFNCAAVAACAAFSFAAPSHSPVVQTTDGLVRGVENEKYRSFRGIPFAAPPLGKLRWTPPAPVEPWEGQLDATDYRHNCLQVRTCSLSWGRYDAERYA